MTRLNQAGAKVKPVDITSDAQIKCDVDFTGVEQSKGE